MIAARAIDETSVVQHIEEAKGYARRTGDAADVHWLSSGPANVAMHQMSAAVEMRRYDEALSQARAIRLPTSVATSRRAHFSIDRARSEMETGPGRDTRSCVALYACISTGQDPEPTLAQLREYAAAQGLTVTAALYDVASLTQPREQRRALTRVTRLIEDRRIDGIVTPSAAHLGATTPTDRAKLGAWLGGLGARGAFIRYAETTGTVSS